MKKVLSVILVLVLMMSVALSASAADATALAEGGSMLDIGGAFDALSDFLKLDPIMVFVNGFHEAMGGFYVQLDTWLRALRVVVDGVLTGIFATA